jgi:hypothetical protein
MKEAWQRQRDGSNTSTGFIVQEGVLWRGSPAREPTAAYRLGVDSREQSGGEALLGGKILQEWNQQSLGEAREDKLLSSRPPGGVA